MSIKYTTEELDILKKYVDTNNLENEEEYNVIKQMVLRNEPVSLTVYRGHNGTRKINSEVDWFSTSTNKSIAKQKFFSSEKNCCLFTIHLKNIKSLFVNKTGMIISKTNRASENEVIVLGGGIFYLDEDLSEEGFYDNGNGEYETWYAVPEMPSNITESSDNNNNKNIIELFKSLDPEEYEFIENVNNVKLYFKDLSDKDANDLLQMVISVKPKSGGFHKKTYKKKNSRRAKKRPTKKRRKTHKRKYYYF